MHLIAYTSQSKINNQNFDQEMANILETSKKNNSLQHITGVLFYMQNRFLQVVEGDEKDVRMLISNIKKDDRHHKFKYVFDLSISERGFSDWSMNYFNLNKDTKFGLETLRKIRNGLQKNDLILSNDILSYYKAALK